jgi:sugar-specific transcriptional regulator TrmB/DNA-binding CsgD family transcriptional regulator
MLDALGLDPVHTDVYRSVLQRPSASVAEGAADLGLGVGRVRALIGDLEGLGLLARQASEPGRVVASPPAMALRPLLIERERGLTRAHETLVELSDLYRRAADQRSAAEVLDVVLGNDAVRQRVAQLQAAATSHVRALVLSDVALLSPEDNVEEDRAIDRGVKYRVIVESGVLERPGFLTAAREGATRGTDIRVRSSLPTRMFIADDTMALLPMREQVGDGGFGALMVHPSGLLDLIIAIFEEYWAQSTEFLRASDRPVSSADLDRDLLKLLLLGLTDAAAAAQLKISVRTVQRRIADLMGRAGVSTRIQLGAEAVRRGWV